MLSGGSTLIPRFWHSRKCDELLHEHEPYSPFRMTVALLYGVGESVTGVDVVDDNAVDVVVDVAVVLVDEASLVVASISSE